METAGLSYRYKKYFPLRGINQGVAMAHASLKLTVNEIPIQTDHFVAGFVEHTISGMIESLEGAGKIKDLTLAIDGETVEIELNGAKLQTNVFASRIVKSTVAGMLAPLKGVSDIKKVTVIINK